MPTVIPIDRALYRRAPSGTAGISLLARGENAFVGRLQMDAGAKMAEHRDPTEEYIYVLEGHGTLRIDDQVYAVKPGTTVFMPANAKVSYDNGSEAFVGIQVFAGPAPADKYETWHSLRR